MLPYVLSSPPARLLRPGLVLKDADRKQHTFSGIDEGVIHEPFDLAHNGQKALIHVPNHFARVGHALVAPYRCVHRFTLPPFWPALGKRRADPFHKSMMPPPPARCEVRRNREIGSSTSENSYSTQYGE